MNTNNVQSGKGPAQKARTARKANSAEMNGMEDTHEEMNEAEFSGEEEGSEPAQKSVGAVIAESLSQGTQQKIDQSLGQISDVVNEGRAYISENKKEAAILAVTAGLSAYVLLSTKPGRKIFDLLVATYAPQATKVLSGVLAGVTSPEVKH